jgi:hypothetical protein
MIIKKEQFLKMLDNLNNIKYSMGDDNYLVDIKFHKINEKNIMHAYVYEVPNNDDLEFTLELGSH